MTTAPEPAAAAGDAIGTNAPPLSARSTTNPVSLTELSVQPQQDARTGLQRGRQSGRVGRRSRGLTHREGTEESGRGVDDREAGRVDVTDHIGGIEAIVGRDGGPNRVVVGLTSAPREIVVTPVRKAGSMDLSMR